MVTRVEPSVAPDSAPDRVPARPRVQFAAPATWPYHWPLTVMLVGFPLWWAFGVASFMPILMAVPMALQLLRVRPIRVPGGFGWWLLFLMWVAASATMLWVDAPTAVPGGGGSRLFVFTYRLLLYLAATVVLLWICNSDEQRLPTRHVVRICGWMFVVTVAGGLLGVTAPTFEFDSLAEIVLPGAVTSNPFTKALMHPSAASIQRVLGEEGARPIAPFAYANSWGSNFSLFLPFFLVGWLGRAAGWRRIAAPAVLALAAIPVVYSLNRGLWASLAAGAVFVVVRLALKGRIVPLVSSVAVLALAAGLFALSPLADMGGQRLANPHSNERRGQLLSETVSNTVEGSPVLGFGSTRDVRGSFASIAGGGTPECPACRVPPLGTQGQLWLVIFSQGLVGLVLFLGFFTTQAAQHWRTRSPVETIGMALLLFFGLQLFVYDMLGMPFYTVMLGIGLMWRQHHAPDPAAGSSLEMIWAQVRRHLVLIVVLAVLGGGAGVLFSRSRPLMETATVAILLAPSPVHLDLSGENEPREITIDTEASMVFSERAISRVREELDLPQSEDLRDKISVTAPRNTRVLNIHVKDRDGDRASEIADTLSLAYLDVRGEYLTQRRDQVLHELNLHLSGGLSGNLSGAGEVLLPDDGEDSLERRTPAAVEQAIRDEIQSLVVTETDAGEVIRSAVARPDRRQIEVPVVSGALLGALLGVVVMAIRRPRRA